MAKCTEKIRLDRSKYRTKVYLQENADESQLDEYGTPIKNPDTPSKWIMACVQTLSGRQLEEGRRIMDNASVRISHPYLDFLNTNWRYIIARTGQVIEIGHLNNVNMQFVEHIALGMMLPTYMRCEPDNAPKAIRSCPPTNDISGECAPTVESVCETVKGSSEIDCSESKIDESGSNRSQTGNEKNHSPNCGCK